MADNTTFIDIIKENYGNYDPNKLSTKEIDSLGKDPYFVIIMILILIWALLGLVAFIMSIVCFTRSGSAFEKVMGLILAIFLGPLYFLFFAFSNTYCK
jgi:low affinity Fe/Cu permease